MRRAAGLIAIAASLALLWLGATPAYADPSGNNGTIKIVNDQGDSQDDPDNDPHVCAFHIFGSNFDRNSTGTWTIVAWAPGGGPLTAAMSAGSWAADASGRFDARPAQPFPDGHYKLSAKQNGAPGGDKHKVFWVRCGSAGTVSEAATAATTSVTAVERGNAAVAGVQTAPKNSAVAGNQSATTMATPNAVAGVQNLPSTSTADMSAYLLGLGAMLTLAGGLILRRSARMLP